MIWINPSNEESLTIRETDPATVPQLIEIALKGGRRLSRLPLLKRKELLLRIVSILSNRREEISALVAVEMGKPLQFAQRELARCIEEIQYTIEHLDEWLTPEACPGGTVYFEPLGTVAVISPWNFPIMLPLRGIIPALATGNGVVFKPSELTPRCGILISEIVQSAFQEYSEAFQIAIGGKELGKSLVEHGVDLIAFTGSTSVGKWIAAESSKKLTRCVLELGGLDAAIVLPDADLSKDTEQIIRANAINSGQVCNALKRVFIHESIAQQFIERAVKVSSGLTIGDPMQSPDMGPLVSRMQMERVLDFIEDARQRGAKILTGGKRIDKPGFFIEHTLISDIPSGTRCLTEEPFGPILPIITYSRIEDAISQANSTPFGLTASVWGKSYDQCIKIARDLIVGTVSINSHAAGSPGAPWGGAKESGIGRMKTKEGLREFTNIKLIR